MIKKQNFNDSYQHEEKPQITSEGPDADHLRKMFLGGLTPNTNEEMVRQFYYQFGEIDDVVIMRDPATKRSRGFGFVTFKTTASVDKAQLARPHVVDGRTIDSKRALPRTDSVRNDGSNSVRKVFVGGLKDYHDEECLREYFEQFGKVVSVNILVDKITGRKRGFAFVEFDDYDTVDKVVLRSTHTIKYMLVDVKKSNYKQVQAKRLALQQQTGSAGGDTNAVEHGGYPASQPGYHQYSYPPPQAPYAGWGYPQTNVPYAQQTQSYEGYAPPQQNSATAPAWSGYPAPGWGQQNAYAAPPNANGWTATPNATQNAYVAQPAANSWSATSPPPNGTQTFGSYQQTYNGGPQKNSNLQGNRMNPYSV